MDEIFYLDELGYETYKEILNNLENNKLNKINAINSSKDIEDTKKLRVLLSDINKKIKMTKDILNNAKNVESNTNNDTLGVGDVVKVKAYISVDEIYEDIYELTSCENNFDYDIPKISINSPLGRAIYNSSVGSTVYYELKEDKIKVDILEKINIKKKELINN